MTLDFTAYPLSAIFVVSIVVVLGACEGGRYFGQRAAAAQGSDISTLEGAALGLLALMIGFTFAMALSRYDSRRMAVLDEANAIGTTALRGRLLPSPHDGEVLKLLSDYVQVRVDLIHHVATPAELQASVARSNDLHELLWRQAKAVAAKDAGMVPTGLFIQSLNEMIDNQEKRLTAVRNRAPTVVLVALYGIAAVAAAFAGYTSGLVSRRSRLPVYVTALLITAVILLIQDLDRPGTGFIGVSQQPMLDTAESIAGWLAATPR